jgi:uncharacterized membrane protein
MSVAFTFHTLAVIVWLGGLFFLCVVSQPSTRDLDAETALSLWHRTLSRFFAWAWISLLLILATGISMVFLKFGGFSDIPILHQVNRAIGIPAIALYGYLYFGPWQQFRRAMSRHDLTAAQKDIARVRVVMAVILTLGVVASVVSAAGRYI